MSTLKHQLTGPITRSDYVSRRNTLLIAITGFTIITYVLLSQSFKTLDDLSIANGQLISKEVVKEQYRGNNFRYTFVFKLNNMDQFLGLFLGSGDNAIEDGNTWDNKVKIGDNLKVYYANNLITENENITRLIRRIERDNEVIYQTGTKGRRIMGLSMLGVDFLFVGLFLWVRKRYNMTKRGK